MSEILKRSQVDPKDTWDLSHIFKDEKAWEAAFEGALQRVKDYAVYDGQVAKNPKQAIRDYFSLYDAILPVYEYAMLSKEADNGDTKAQEWSDRAEGLYVQAVSATSFLMPELLAMPDEELAALQVDPEMKDYDEYIRTLRLQKPHTLSKAEEHLLAMMGEVMQGPQKTFSMLTSVDMKFPDMEMPDGTTVPLTEGTYGQFRVSSDRGVREQSFEKIFGTYHKYGNTIAATYSTSVKKDVALALARHYESARQAAMEPLEIPETVYDNLIAVVHESLPILERYLRLRAKVMGVEELHMYDLYAPLVSDFEMNLPFDEAFQLVLEGLKPMGEDYLDKLREAKENRWMDVYPTENKTAGAFSAGYLADVHPYVLLNHTNNLDSAFVIAHELGHSMHSFYSNTSQPSPKRDYSLFVAEVASTCNEAVMMRYLLTRFEDPKAQAFLLNHFMEQFRTTVFRQTMFAEFEKIVHEMQQKGEPLTMESLSKVYYHLNMLYYGQGCVVDPLIENEWMRIPHFYNGFYVYVYATGLCAAVSLSERILTEGEEAVQAYRNFLSAGCSLPPLDALRLAGIDMEKPEPLRKAMGVFSQIIDRFEALVEG